MLWLGRSLRRAYLRQKEVGMFDQKIIVFTDLHFVDDGETIINLDPARRFAEGLEHALTHHPDAARIVIMGDLTHHGRTAQYNHLRQVLAGAPIPVSFMLGNHDNRRVFRKAFPEAPHTSTGHIQEMIDLGPACLITLDSFNADAEPPHSGSLCTDRLNWLDQALAWANDKPVIVAIHHPPFAIGFPGMDKIALQNPEPLLERLRAYSAPVHLLCGHVHRTISGVAHGLPFTVLKSPCHQMPMLLKEDGSAHSVDEPGAYGIVLINPDSIVVHTEDFVTAAAATATGGADDYRALVCILLAGGNDSFNMLVPNDADQYGEYASLRADLALPQETLLPLAGTTASGRNYALHPGMPEVQSLYASGDLALIANVGTLIEGVDAASIEAGARIPLGLFSHADQIAQWQTAQPDVRSAVTPSTMKQTAPWALLVTTTVLTLKSFAAA